MTAARSRSVLLDIRGLQPGYKAHVGRGIGRVVHELAVRLPRAAPDLDFVGLVQSGLELPDGIMLGNCPIKKLALPWPPTKIPDRLLGQELCLPIQTRNRPGIVHYPAHLDGPGFGGRRMVVTVHDLILADNSGSMAKGGLVRRLLRSLEARCARQARLVTTVSKTTAQEVKDKLGVRPEKIRVVPNGVGDNFRPDQEPRSIEACRRRFGLGEGYFLCVGGFDPRKNFERLIPAFKDYIQATEDKGSLVLVGSTTDRSQVEPVRAAIRKAAMEDRVVFTGFVGDDLLPLLYAGAKALLFPSLYEGFGLPAVEAMAAGCPVLAGDRAALPEVVGRAGLLFDPTRTEEITRAMIRLANEPGLSEKLREAGLDRARRYSWDRAAARMAEVYREALEMGTG